MRKIPTMFIRDEIKNGHPVTNQIKPECQWVLDGEGIATRKLDGTNVKVWRGLFYKRQKPISGEYDEASYVPVDMFSPENKWIVQAFKKDEHEDGIYEACGPKIQGNPEKFADHVLVKVSPVSQTLILNDVPRDFDGLKKYLAEHDIEGIVFHRENGEMAKIKKKDFGIKR